jgi:hypothetical protein
MRKYINIINEGIDPRSGHPAFTPDDGDTQVDHKPELDALFAQVFEPLKLLAHRDSIEAVYNFVLEDFPLDDAIGHIAKRDGMNPAELRDLVIKDYKQIRGQSETYASPIGHTLVSNMNAQIREAFDAAALDHDDMLIERQTQSLKCGAYTNGTGARVIVLRAAHDPQHYMVVNQKGEVVASHHGDPALLDQKLKADGFTGAIITD